MRLDFVYLQNVVCSSVGNVAASVRLLYIHFRSLYAGNHWVATASHLLSDSFPTFARRL